jgi:cobalt-zinc-cadmium efflux system protein
MAVGHSHRRGVAGHLGHRHPPVTSEADARHLGIALALIVGLMVAEVVAGILANSLALLSDAAHMLTDAAALGLSLVVIHLIARRGPGGNLTFGLRRAEILSAQANGLTLLVLGCLILYGGIGRIITPQHPGGLAMVVVAVAGIVVNLAATRELARANRASLNVEGSYQHLLTDLVAFVLTAVAGVAILATGFREADGIAAVVIALIMLRAAYGLLRDSGRVLLEAAPGGMSVDEIGAALVGHPHVTSVHDLHVWEIGSGFPALSAHVLVHPGDDCHAIRQELEAMLAERFEIGHTTLQVDHERGERLLTITPAH